jgi:hypothetical protein
MISFLLIILAGIFNSVMDVLKSNFCQSKFSDLNPFFWNPTLSWHNKWKNGDAKQGEKFFGASTFLVWLTDAWHVFKMLMLVCIMLSVVLYHPWLGLLPDFFLHLLGFTIPFELCFRFWKA